jgi:linoleate 10R-lipoxygenase
LKVKENSRGVFTENEMFMIMAVIFTSIFFDVDTTKSFSLHHAARAASQQLGQIIESHVKSINSPGFLSGFIDSFRGDHNVLKEYGDQLIKKLLESGLGVSDVTYSQVLPAAVAMIHNQAQMASFSLHALRVWLLTSSVVHSNYRLLPLRGQEASS